MPNSGFFKIAWVINFLAIPTAVSKLFPFANSAVITAENVQPVPCVFLVEILGELKVKTLLSIKR